MSDPRLCVVCARTELEPAKRQCCVKCLSRTRSNLTEIERLYALLPTAIDDRAGVAGSIMGGSVRSAEDQVIGGDAMVLLGPGSAGTNQARDIITGRNQSGIHATDEYPGDVMSVLGELERWERDWRHVLGLPAAQDEAMVSSCGLFLQRHLTVMAQRHDAFDEFAEDMRKIVGRLRGATGGGEPVDRGKRIECEECGQPLIRRYRKPSPCEHPSGYHCNHSHPNPVRWTCRGSNTCSCDQGGRTDHWVCSSRTCDIEVDDASYWLRVKQRMERQQAWQNEQREAC